MRPALILSTHTTGYGVIRSLGCMGVPVFAMYYSPKDMGYLSKYVNGSIAAPHPERHEDEFISLLVKYGGRLDGAILIPADDETLSVVSRHKNELEEYYTVACPEWDITKKFIDKRYTYSLAESVGVPVPFTVVPQSASEAEKYGREIGYPCLVKPCQSHTYFEKFKIKSVIAENSAMMLEAYNQSMSAGIDVMLQEFIPGSDASGVNYNSYFWNDTPLVEFTAEKCRLSPPTLGIPRVAVSKDIPEVMQMGRKVLQALRYYGYSCTEFKKDARDGIYKFLEVNGRHNRSNLLAMRCGINFPWIEYKHLMEGQIPSQYSFKCGVYWIDEFKDITGNFVHFLQERYSLAQYIVPYFHPHVFANFDMGDVKPFFKRLKDIVFIVAKSISHAHS